MRSRARCPTGILDVKVKMMSQFRKNLPRLVVFLTSVTLPLPMYSYYHSLQVVVVLPFQELLYVVSRLFDCVLPPDSSSRYSTHTHKRMPAYRWNTATTSSRLPKPTANQRLTLTCLKESNRRRSSFFSTMATAASICTRRLPSYVLLH